MKKLGLIRTTPQPWVSSYTPGAQVAGSSTRISNSFTPNQKLLIHGVCRFGVSGNTANFSAQLYEGLGTTLLGQATITGVTGGGWACGLFTTPIEVNSGTLYAVSVVETTANQRYNMAGTGTFSNVATHGLGYYQTNLTGAWVAGVAGQLPPVSFLYTEETPPEFLLSASVSSLSIIREASGNFTVTITPHGSFSGSVALDVGGLPAGVTPSWSVNPATTSSVLTLHVSSTAALGTVPIEISGVSTLFTTLGNTLTIPLTILRQPRPPLDPRLKRLATGLFLFKIPAEVPRGH